jgi:hypothetical protein
MICPLPSAREMSALPAGLAGMTSIGEGTTVFAAPSIELFPIV